MSRAGAAPSSANAWRRALLRGGVPALATIGVSALLPPVRRLELHAILLACAAAVYIGIQLAGDAGPFARVEAPVGVGFIGVALAGLWWSPSLLPAGWLLHGGWDLTHHRARVPEGGGAWYPSACLLYDLALAAYLTAWLAAGSMG